ncbi:hypothetical protein OC842_004941 [Tilletia horrida]|uniref:Uncharacterized protein n=1 Tax=Tilletia horrida TaxID=155126 RepID=A0AAN6GD94_9BASI|nr:hypothetical protein OC842_004941 [Tilletia horrida]
MLTVILLSQRSVWLAGAVAVTVVALGSLALASPSNLAADAPLFWLQARAGSAVGQPCDSSSQCFTNYCQDFTCTAEPCHPVCHYAPAGDHCVANAQCTAQKCTHGRCAYSPIGGYCDNYWDCLSDGQTSADCFSNKCKYKPGNACKSADECGTGFCIGGICSRPPQPPNAVCSRDSECISKSCQNLPSCYSQNGTEIECVGDSYTHCTRFPLGSKCQHNGDCAEGFCRSGTCVASKSGDPCVAESQCVGISICGTSGKCHTPRNHSLFPQQTCGADQQCYSNKCVSKLDVTDIKDITLPYFGRFPEPTRCDYLGLGQSKCRTYVDCSEGICKHGTCELGADGDRCLYNAHCKNVCGSDGLCYSPPSDGSLALNQPCTTGSQCFSGVCDTDDLVRPLPYTPSETVHIIDSACYPSAVGGKCSQDSDCSRSACQHGACVLLQVGQTCSRGLQCATGICDSKTTGGKTAVCRLGATHESCATKDDGEGYSDAICQSRSCVLRECDYECGTEYWCAPVRTGGACRFSADCDAGASCVGAKCASKSSTPTPSTSTKSTASSTKASSATSKTAAAAAAAAKARGARVGLEGELGASDADGHGALVASTEQRLSLSASKSPKTHSMRTRTSWAGA